MLATALNGIAGGAGACCAVLVTNPIEVVKVRLQMQGEGTRLAGKEKLGTVASVRQIVTREGLSGLYKGTASSLVREATFATYRFGAFLPSKRAVYALTGGGSPDETVSFWRDLVSGAVVGAMGSAIANPMDLIKIRMQAAADGARYTGPWAATQQILSAEGIRGLYSGVAVTAQRAAVGNASQLASYVSVKDLVQRHVRKENDIFTHTMSAFGAGFFASICLLPLDTARTRLMTQASAAEASSGKAFTKQRYTSTLDCFVKISRAEGVLALWKGFIRELHFSFCCFICHVHGSSGEYCACSPKSLHPRAKHIQRAGRASVHTQW